MIAHPDRNVNAAILLASASPRRRELVKLLGLPVETTAADIDEVPLPNEPANLMAVRLSREKARVAASFTPQASSYILLASDTVVSLDGEPLGKPRDAAEARSMLRQLRNRTHQVYTAITLIDTRSSFVRSDAPGANPNRSAVPEKAGAHTRCSPTGMLRNAPVFDGGGLSGFATITDLAGSDVPMRAYADAEIEAYIASGDPFDKAGAYAIQHRGFHPVEHFDHCFANVMGLPLCHIARSLRKLGVEPPQDVPNACQQHIHYRCPVFEEILK